MTLTRWQHALLSLIILFGMMMLILLACVKPSVSYYQALQTELNTKQERLQRYRAVAAQQDELIPFYQQQLNSPQDQQYFLKQVTPSLAAAKLQEKIKSLLALHQGQLISTQAVPVQKEEILTPVMIRINMKSDIEALLKILHSLESTKPLAFIDNLQIQRVGGARNNHQRKSKLTIKPLNTRFDLRVYMLNEKVKP